MSKHVILTVVIVLPIGLAGGAAASYVWLRNCGSCRVGIASGHEEADVHSAHDNEQHAEDSGHGGHEEGVVRLSDEMMRQLDIKVSVAGGGDLERTLHLPGEIVLNADRVAHIVPRVAGMVREVRKNVGDEVEAGELMAVLESRELAEAKAADLAAEARLRLAERNYKRVEELVQKKISPEQEIHEARQKLEEAQIAHRETSAKLYALGLDHDEVSTMNQQNDAAFSRYEIRAPFAGCVVDKHVVLGEVHDSGSDVFVVTDLSNVWVDITTYTHESAQVRPGARVRVSAPGPGGRPMTAEGTISYTSPIIRESTRTGLARAVLANENLAWKPGLFVTAEIVVGSENVPVLVPNEAIQTVEGQTVVFVVEDDGFKKRPVVVGGSNKTHTALVSGIEPGERYVAGGAFILKAELSKGTGGHEH
jgi:cobalt-zinc-cadmium efflux system membrane fusion protein